MLCDDNVQSLKKVSFDLPARYLSLSGQPVDLLREGKRLIGRLSSLQRRLSGGRRGSRTWLFDLWWTVDETLFFCHGGEMRSAPSDRADCHRVLNLPNHCQIFDQGEANGLQKKNPLLVLLCSFFFFDSDFAFIYFSVRFAYVAFLHSGIYVMLQKQQLATWDITLI